MAGDHRGIAIHGGIVLYRKAQTMSETIRKTLHFTPATLDRLVSLMV